MNGAKKPARRMRLRVYFVLMIVSVAVAAVVGSMLGSLLFRKFGFFVELLFSGIFCLLCSAAAVLGFTEYLVGAIKQLRLAMATVAGGDFSVRLTR